MKDKTNNENISFPARRVAFAAIFGWGFCGLVFLILGQIGPEPGGIAGMLRAPSAHGFCEYLGSLFNMIALTLFYVCCMVGIYIGIVFRNKNITSEWRKKSEKCMIVYGTILITGILYIGVLAVKYILGYGSPNRVHPLDISVVILLGLTIGTIIVYRQWIINKLAYPLD